MTKKLKTLLLLPLFFNGCTHGHYNSCPKSSFNSYFPKRAINLTNRLGDAFKIEFTQVSESKTDTIDNKLVISQDSTKDTLSYRIVFNKATKTNLIINADDNDTVFFGLISIYRGLFYCSEKINDTSYWIGAMRIEDDSIQGLDALREQMCGLDDYLFSNTSPSVYLKDTVLNIIRLKPDKRELSTIYPLIINYNPKYRIIKGQVDMAQKNNYDKNANRKIDSGFQMVSDKLVESYYPNPAKNEVQIDFEKNDNYTIQLIDSKGKTALDKKINDNNVNLNLNGMKSGLYVLRAYSNSEKLVENHKLIIK